MSTTPSVEAVPAGMPAVVPHLCCAGANEAIDFYVKAFGAEEMCRIPGPDGRLLHGAIRIGNSMVFVVDEYPECGGLGPKARGGSSVTIHLQVPDADAAFARAVEAGATAKMPVAEMFWGDRYGLVEDAWGHQWSVATHVRDVDMAELKELAKNMGT